MMKHTIFSVIEKIHEVVTVSSDIRCAPTHRARPIRESPRQGDSIFIRGFPIMSAKTLHFARDLCHAFLNAQKCDSLHFFSIK